MLGGDGVGQRPDLVERCQIGREEPAEVRRSPRVDPFYRPGPSVGIAADHCDGESRGGQSYRGLQADAACAGGDHGCLLQ